MPFTLICSRFDLLAHHIATTVGGEFLPPSLPTRGVCRGNKSVQIKLHRLPVQPELSKKPERAEGTLNGQLLADVLPDTTQHRVLQIRHFYRLINSDEKGNS